jgi:hypothetical protein
MDGSNSNVAELDNLIVQYPPAVLPLTLTSFEAVNVGSSNQLNWTMAQEAQLKSYTVERSGNGADFAAIDSIAPQRGDGTHTYSYADNEPLATSYYRLRMTDINGASTYSAVKKISLTGPAGISVSCYPNPVVNYAVLRFELAVSANYRYSVYTADGRLFQTGAFAISGAGQQAGINLSAAPRGILFIRIESDAAFASTLEVLRQ